MYDFDLCRHLKELGLALFAFLFWTLVWLTPVVLAILESEF